MNLLGTNLKLIYVPKVIPAILEKISECVCGPFQNGPFQILRGGTKTRIFGCVCGGPFEYFFRWAIKRDKTCS